MRRGAPIAKYPFFGDLGGFDVEGFRQAVLARATNRRMIVILNFPNNPTGYSVTTAVSDEEMHTWYEEAFHAKEK